ncbi:AsmA-like C-terminal region-containing protein [Alloacidobacterium sp.]|uniref:AsmA-like C-terminal region-containing protein n=1 Tax=Alloacidobacterium sp. TaxID=2951999 RepID=UPI002D408E63|nr:AsmA-like C-terminal region-containing protein [Alloacidobacterium sp.]HYK37853.1 AsmA-like C-terminal region-containing protein [Alloacidobacterium sp.]
MPVIALLAAGVYLADQHWPFRYRNVHPLLEQVFASRITVSDYHRIYFPHPGFVAKGLTLRRNSVPGLPPIGSTEDLIVQGSWLDLLLFSRHIRLVDVKGLHIVIPPVGSKENREDFPAGSSVDFSGPSTTVEELYIHDAALDIMRVNGGKYTFPIRQLIMRGVQKGQAVPYFVDMQNASPTGHIQATGRFGPLVATNLGSTHVSGTFTFTQVNLSGIGELRGMLSANGHFTGALSAIEAYATAEAPDFAVNKGRPIAVHGSAQCTVNALNGNTVLHEIKGTLGDTTVSAAGTVAGTPNAPKATDLDLTVTRGRAQDLLHPFLEDRPPIAGVVSLKAHAHLTPQQNHAKFLQRLSVDGGFHLPDERVNDPAKEKTLTEFSERAQVSKHPVTNPAIEAEDSPPLDVLSSLEGQVKIRDGVVSTRWLTFSLPGASVNLNGSYNLSSGNVHLVGNLKMDSDISHVTTGFKSLLLKPLIPFFKKDNAGANIPIAITGGPNDYKVSQNLLHKK